MRLLNGMSLFAALVVHVSPDTQALPQGLKVKHDAYGQGSFRAVI